MASKVASQALCVCSPAFCLLGAAAPSSCFYTSVSSSCGCSVLTTLEAAEDVHNDNILRWHFMYHSFKAKQVSLTVTCRIKLFEFIVNVCATHFFFTEFQKPQLFVGKDLPTVTKRWLKACHCHSRISRLLTHDCNSLDVHLLLLVSLICSLFIGLANCFFYCYDHQ